MGMQFEQNNDPVKALTHYQRGAAAGDSASNYRLGMMTLMGQMGQQQDYTKGIQMLQLAAEKADENAPQGAYVGRYVGVRLSSTNMITGARHAASARTTPSQRP